MARGTIPALVLAGILLSGCMNLGDGLTAGRGARASNAHAATSVQVMSKGFTIAGPKGYCIDTGAVQETADRAFAVLGSCAVISGNPRDTKPAKPAMLTASVTQSSLPLDDAALDRMTAFFSTAEGRAALARADGAGDVSVIDLTRKDGLLLVHAEDGAEAGLVTADYWRGVFETEGKLVTVTVSGYREAPLDDKSGAKLTRDFVSAIRKANKGGAGDLAQDAGTAPGGVLAGVGERLASFFNRLP